MVLVSIGAERQAWLEYLRREVTVFPTYAKENQREIENFLGKGLRRSVEAGNQYPAIAQINLAEFGIAALVPVSRVVCGFVPEVRRFVIGNPFLDRAFRRDDQLEGLDFERWSRRRGNVDDSLPKSPEVDEEFDQFGPPYVTEKRHLKRKWNSHIRLETYKSQDRTAMDVPRRESVKL